MATDVTPADLQLLYEYLGRRLANGGAEITPEDSVQEFRAYQAELQQFVEQTKHAQQQSENGEATPLDLEALRERVRQRAANEGKSL